MSLFTILYVSSPAASATFYEKILGIAPLDVSPTFAFFKLSDGHMLGLWQEQGVEPTSIGTGARSELCIEVQTKETLAQMRDAWTKSGATLLQDIVDLDFGTAFTVTDPDGHRLRAMVPQMH